MLSHSDPTTPAGPQAAHTTGTRAEQINYLLSLGQAAARAGKRSEARRLFQRILALDPTNLDAWLWLAYLAPSLRQTLAYLEQAGAHHPGDPRLREALAWTKARLPREDTASAARRVSQWSPALPTPGQRLQPSRAASDPNNRSALAKPQAIRAPSRRFHLHTPVIGLTLLILILGGLGATIVAHGGLPTRSPSPQPTPTEGFVTPTPDMATLRQESGQAIANQNWAQAVSILEQLRQLSPEDDGVRQQLAVANLRYGLQLVDMDRIDEAIAHYDAAIRFYANDMDLQTARKLAVNYRDGRAAAQAQHWDDAINLLENVYRIDPHFRDVADLLFSAYMARGQGQEKGQDLPAARDDYAHAADIKPNDQQVQSKLASITATLTPPTPTPTPRPHKRIVVSVAQQHLWAYEDDQEVFSFICSTGTIAAPTQFGTYQILDKMPEAWSSVWSLRMPYWMGIYWAGASEDGIHALPIYSDGRVLWKGNLGHRISYGCIVLDTPDAVALYNWAEVGTTVTVNPD